MKGKKLNILVYSFGYLLQNKYGNVVIIFDFSNYFLYFCDFNSQKIIEFAPPKIPKILHQKEGYMPTKYL
jgi:hypothetical protein